MDKRLFFFEDLSRINHFSNLKISPDGNWLICVVTQVDKEENCRRDYVALINVSDKSIEILAEGSSPIWSPDGTEIAFESNKNNKSGIWILNIKNRTERFLTTLSHSDYFINHLEDKSFCWSADGSYIAYVGTSETTTGKGKESNVQIIDRLLYKTKGGRDRKFYADDCFTHIWMVPVKNGKPELITNSAYNDHSISLSPDGSQIAFISNRSNNPDNNQYSDLWKINIKSKEITRLTNDLGSAFLARWSPDGKFIAFLATTRAINTNDSMADDTHLFIIPENGGVPVGLTKLLDRRVDNFQWHPDSAFIYFTAGDKGKTQIYRVSIESSKIEIIVEGRFHISEFSLNSDGHILVYICNDIINLPEIFSYRGNSTKITKITSQNQIITEECILNDAEEFWYTSFDSLMIQGWIIKPSLFNENKVYPTVMVIHGGPHNMFGYDFDERMQLLSANGYVVVYINPRGSSGYGQAFSYGNLLNWGGGDYKDLMAGIDFIIDKYKWIDPEYLGVTGQSYGGYLANWIITQTDRFKAAVVDGGISNLISFSGTSIYHSLIESEFNGNIYDNFSLLWQWSPLRNVKSVSTPTLFLHGEIDNEVPPTQAEEMYVAMKKLEIETKLILYRGEGHGWRPDLKPDNRIDLIKRMIEWFNIYLKKN